MPSGPFEAEVVQFITTTLGWGRDEYRLEHRGRNQSGTRDLTAVVFLADECAAAPCGGQSFVAGVDPRTRAVVVEEAGQ